jgi:hypothetical protein
MLTAMKNNLYLIILFIVTLAMSCNNKQLPGVSPYSAEKELFEFSFLRANNPSLNKDYLAKIEGVNIFLEIPKGIKLNNLVPTYKISEKATLKIGNQLIESGKTEIDVANFKSLSVTAENLKNNIYYASLLLIGLMPNLDLNSNTSYTTYLNNNLYIDLSFAIPNTILNKAYQTDSYTARAYGDFDKDGDMDIIAVASNSNGTTGVDVEYFKNNTFQFNKDQTVFAAGAPKMLNGKKVIVGDFDKNGWLDVLIVGTGFDRIPYSGEKVKILLNTNGTFTTKELNLNSEYYGSITAGDVDNDGDLDLFITTNQSISKFMINDGKANFTYDKDLYPNTLYNKGFFASELYDMDNDGFLDLVTAGHEHNGAASTVFFGNASGTYLTTKMATLTAVADFGIIVDIDFIDYDKDGKKDILITRTGDGKEKQGYYVGYYLQLLKNNGNSFTDVTKIALLNNSSISAKWINWIRILDIDNDGDLDITTDDKMYKLVWTNNNGIFSSK